MTTPVRFSNTTEYALRVMAVMARTPAERFSVRRLHEALDLPQKYLGRIMGQLTQAGLLTATRGKHGGYQLAGAPAELSLLPVVAACEGLESFERCLLGLDRCDPEHPCGLHHRVAGLRSDIFAALQSTTLADLAEGRAIRPRAGDD